MSPQREVGWIVGTLLGLLVLGLLLSGCSTTWVGGDGPFAQDSYACERDAEMVRGPAQTADVVAVYAGRARAQRLYDSCMTSKNWRKQ